MQEAAGPPAAAADTLPDVPGESTSYRRLVEHVLGVTDICAYVTEQMAAGHSRRAIARDLTQRVGVPGVEISDVLLYRWCRDDREDGPPDRGA
jgi:hypothetical protein